MTIPKSFPPPSYVAAPSHVDGIEVYAPRREVAAARDAELHCPSCGSTTALRFAQGALTCGDCGYEEAPKAAAVGKQADAFEFERSTLEQAAHGVGEPGHDATCSACGANFTVPPGRLTASCPFCAASRVVHRQAPHDALRPRFVIPFSLPAERLGSIVDTWFANRHWLVPDVLGSGGKVDAFTPTHLPYWTFDAVARAHWTAAVGNDYERDGKTRTDWSNEEGRCEETFDDLLIPGAEGLGDERLTRVADFDLRALATYDAGFLAGTHARASDLTLDEAWAKGRETMRERTREACRKSIHGDHIRDFAMTLDFADENWRYVLLPVYIAAYRYKGKAYRVFVNGQTGTIVGAMPVDDVRKAAATIAALAPGAWLTTSGWLHNRFGFTMVGLGVLALGAWVVAKVWIRAHELAQP